LLARSPPRYGATNTVYTDASHGLRNQDMACAPNGIAQKSSLVSRYCSLIAYSGPARQVTAANPAPVTLRLEKIYEPCMLVTKKRYVGFMHESPAQTVPSWDAKVMLYAARLAQGVSQSRQCVYCTWAMPAWS